MRLRRIPIVLVMVVAAACGDGDDGEQASTSSTAASTTTTTGPTTTSAAEAEPRWVDLPPLRAEELPPLLIAVGTTIHLHHGDDAESVATLPDPVGVALGDPGGDLFAELQADDEGVELVRVRDGAVAEVIVGRAADRTVWLYDLQDERLLYGVRTAVEEPGGPLVLRQPDGTEHTLREAFAVEFWTVHASMAGCEIVASAYSDLTESVYRLTCEGEAVQSTLDPTADLPYNKPPLVISAELSPDGRELAWLEGPDWDGATGTTVGEWFLVVGDHQSGERLRLRVAGLDGGVTRMEFDGRFAALSAEDDDGVALPGLIVDTLADPPRGAVVEPAGVMTFATVLAG